LNSKGQRYCSRASRLFSGDPSALFAQDSQFLNVAATLDAGLSSPFQFVLDTPQVPNTQFWHLPKVAVLIYTPAPNSISNFTPNQQALFLCPGSMVGSVPQDDSGEVNGVNISNLGVQIQQTEFNLMNDTNGTHGGLLEILFDGPVEVPPLWFLRFCIFDIESGPNNLYAQSQISLRAQQQIIQLGFETKF